MNKKVGLKCPLCEKVLVHICGKVLVEKERNIESNLVLVQCPLCNNLESHSCERKEQGQDLELNPELLEMFAKTEKRFGFVFLKVDLV